MNAHSPYVPRKIDLVFEVVHGPRQAFAGLRMVCKNRTRFACVPNV